MKFVIAHENAKLVKGSKWAKDVQEKNKRDT